MQLKHTTFGGLHPRHPAPVPEFTISTQFTLSNMEAEKYVVGVEIIFSIDELLNMCLLNIHLAHQQLLCYSVFK